MLLKLVIAVLVLVLTRGDCGFMVNQTAWPYVPDDSQKGGVMINEAMCEEFIGKQGCCTHEAYLQMQDNFLKIDTIFGSSQSGGSGGCDLCSINLKRFWCTYACAMNQADFVQVGDWTWVTSYDHPGEKVYVQQISLKVESTTACRLFQSCQRTSYAAQLSALQSPAGFLNFQGTNAMDAHQIIYVDFTDDKTKGLYIEELDNCSIKLPTPPNLYRGFEVIGNCSCNTCQSECTGESYYSPTKVMEGFNYEMVFWTWGAIIVSIVGITVYRYLRDKKRRN